jgi:molybdopterin synthase catalytic subunit
LPLIRISEDEVSLEEVEAAVRREAGTSAGAVCTFLGLARQSTVEPDGSARDDVEALHYEAYVPMAQRVLATILNEAAQRFGAQCAVTHRLGSVAVGQASIAIAVATPHRAQAFEACRYIIDEIKSRAPIWKQESAGATVWWSGANAARAPKPD